MSRLIVVLLILSAVTACEEPEPESRMATDAIALGMEKIECNDEIRRPVYTRLDTMGVTREASCAALARAIFEIRMSERVPDNILNPDSVLSAVVWPIRVGRAATVDSGYQVYFDLEHRSHFLFVSWLSNIDRPAEVSWAPEGLSY